METAVGSSKPHETLREALELARATGRDETVVFHLREEGVSAPPTAAQTLELAEALMKRAVSLCGLKPKRKTVFQNLGAITVQAQPDLLLTMLDQPQVHAAFMNQTQPNPIELIRPVRKAPADKSGWADLEK